MLSDAMLEMLNEQINREQESAYLYLQMASIAKGLGWCGLSHWMRVQYHEELYHSFKIVNYVEEHGHVYLQKPVEVPDVLPGTHLEFFEATMKHEKFITASLQKIAATAQKDMDFTTLKLMLWFMEEQVEEEGMVGGLIDKVNNAEGNTAAIFEIDECLGEREVKTPVNFAGGN